MDPECSVGPPPLKTLRHPAKKRFDGALGRRTIGRSLLGDDAKPIDEHLPRSLRSEDFAPVVEDGGRFARAGPVVLAPGLQDQAIFRLKGHFDQSHVVFFSYVTQGNASNSNFGNQLVSHRDSRSRPRIMKSIKRFQLSKTI